MRPTLSLIKREFTAYFLSPIAYVVLAVFLIVTGSLYFLAFDLLTAKGPRGVEHPMGVLLGEDRFWLVFLFIPPLLTMRLFAEERGTGTLEMLMTSPIKDWQLVFAKYVACYGFYVLMWLPTIVYLPVLMDLKTTFDFSAWTPFGIAFVAGLGLTLLGLILLPTSAMGKGLLLTLIGIAVATIGGYHVVCRRDVRRCDVPGSWTLRQQFGEEPNGCRDCRDGVGLTVHRRRDRVTAIRFFELGTPNRFPCHGADALLARLHAWSDRLTASGSVLLAGVVVFVPDRPQRRKPTLAIIPR
jgi:hypothetical protein